MSKYDPLWEWIQKNGDDRFSLTYDEIEKIAGLYGSIKTKAVIQSGRTPMYML